MEQAIKIKPYSLTGETKPDSSFYSRTSIFRPPQVEIYQSRGEMFAIVSLSSSKPGYDFAEGMERVLQSLEKGYFEKYSGGEIVLALERGLKEAQEEISSLIKVSIEQGQALDFNLVVAVRRGNVFYLGKLGHAYAGLRRGKEFLPFSLTTITSQTVEDKDSLILSTSLFWEKIGRESIAQKLALPPDEMVETFQKEIIQQEEPGALSALVLTVSTAEVPGEEELIEIKETEATLPQEVRLRRVVRIVKGEVPFLLQKGISKLKNILALRREPEVYLRPRFSYNRRTKVLLVLILTFLLIVSIFLTKKIHSWREQKSEREVLVSRVKELVEEATILVESDPLGSEYLLREAEEGLGKVKGASRDIKIEELENSINEIKGKAYITQMLVVKRNPWPKVVAESCFSFNIEKGVINGLGEQVMEPEANWKKIVAVDSYFGNLYLLDTETSQIYKYIAIEGGFSKSFNYFTQPVDLTGAIDLAIDGLIYLLFPDGRIEKYLGGKKEEFKLAGFYPSLENAEQIFTYPEAENLYVLKGGCFSVFKNSGEYQRRLCFEGVEKIDQFVVQEEEGKIWLRSEGEEYQAEIPKP